MFTQMMAYLLFAVSTTDVPAEINEIETTWNLVDSIECGGTTHRLYTKDKRNSFVYEYQGKIFYADIAVGSFRVNRQYLLFDDGWTVKDNPGFVEAVRNNTAAAISAGIGPAEFVQCLKKIKDLL